VLQYVTQFAELVHQLAAYESTTDQLHYITRFMEGLKPHVRLLVAIQLPQDLDTAYTIALVQEEVGDGSTLLNSHQHSRHQHSGQQFQFKHQEEKPLPVAVLPPQTNSATMVPRAVEDRVTTLRNYKRAKGLCFTCGEHWSRDHKCKQTVQLHMV
jgi:hypothetical protein